MTSQLPLFDAQPALPPGFRYAPDVVPRDEEAVLVARLGELPLKEFEFHGYRGKRRTASFGWHYDFGREALDRVDDMPLFLRVLRERAAAIGVGAQHPTGGVAPLLGDLSQPARALSVPELSSRAAAPRPARAAAARWPGLRRRDRRRARDTARPRWDRRCRRADPSAARTPRRWAACARPCRPG